jgi:hypothetical protein
VAYVPTLLIFACTVVGAWASFPFKRGLAAPAKRRAHAAFWCAVVAGACTMWLAVQQAAFEKRLEGSVIGGDSFCYMFIARNKPLTEGPMFGFAHVGQFPLYDIHVQVIDRDAMLDRPPTLGAIKKWANNFDLPNLAPGQTHVPLAGWPLPDRAEVRYSILIGARNGYVNQDLLLRRVEGIWESATRVRRGAYLTGEVIFETISARYRRDADEKIAWQGIQADTTKPQ